MRVVFDYGVFSPGPQPLRAAAPRAAPPPAASVPGSTGEPLGSAAGGRGAEKQAGGAPAGAGAAKASSSREPVVVVRLGPAAEQNSADPAYRSIGKQAVGGASEAGGPRTGETGIPIPGTDYRLETSEAARDRDREVKLHEQAHLSALGPYAASGISYTTRTGPDGESYAVGGRIKADLTEVPGNPRATLQKARAVQRAALAPGSPSGADMEVAAEAYRLARDAREALEETHGLDVTQ